ncbi:MAG: substrate-binding domain-containing protein [Phycisphaeraceae bacterium]|nr:substrate-binding domain-containing protein [Phycisphaerales bacterium]MCB9859815.1 substrate-binding domain-containing protein [Phycisphaeraceae bacterium]
MHTPTSQNAIVTFASIRPDEEPAFMNDVITTGPMRSGFVVLALAIAAGSACAQQNVYTPYSSQQAREHSSSANLVAVGNVSYGTPFRALMLDYQLHTGEHIDTNPTSQLRAINAAQNNKAMAVISRPLMQHEVEAGRFATRVGAEALIAVVNDDNPLQSISVSNLSNIYLGRSRTWMNGKRINAFVAESCVNDTSVYRQEVLHSGLASADVVPLSDESLLETVRSTPGAIGLLPFSSLDMRDLGNLRVLHVGAVEPTYTTIFSGAYELSRPVCIVTDGTPTAQQKQFIDFCLNDVGQQTLANSGRTPLPAAHFAYFDTNTDMSNVQPDTSFALEPDFTGDY